MRLKPSQRSRILIAPTAIAVALTFFFMSGVQAASLSTSIAALLSACKAQAKALFSPPLDLRVKNPDGSLYIPIDQEYRRIQGWDEFALEAQYYGLKLDTFDGVRSDLRTPDQIRKSGGFIRVSTFDHPTGQSRRTAVGIRGHITYSGSNFTSFSLPGAGPRVLVEGQIQVVPLTDFARTVASQPGKFDIHYEYSLRNLRGVDVSSVSPLRNEREVLTLDIPLENIESVRAVYSYKPENSRDALIAYAEWEPFTSVQMSAQIPK